MTSSQYEEIADYRSQARELIAKSRDHLAAGNLHQASEKGWAAASHMAKAVAVAQVWQYDNPEGFNQVLYQARELSGNPQIHILRGIANELHRNRYKRKRHLNPRDIGESLEQIAELLDLLTPLTNPTPAA